MRRRVISALNFFPRGGSSHVARALARELPAQGWDVTVLSGSRADLGDHGDARRFYAGLNVVAVDFGAALASEVPVDPPEGVTPMHASFEDRPDAADPVFARLDDRLYERQVTAWSAALGRAGAADADVLHLHHLTPVHEAAARVAPGVPVVGHLHGTELLMLEAIEHGAPAAAAWPHGEAWAERMRGWADACDRLVVLSPGQVARAVALLDVDPERCVLVPNGFDPARMRPVEIDRAAFWREQLGVAITGPVVLFVGRFTEVKRLPLLIEAFARAQPSLPEGAALVLVGGHPGEWEGEHPRDAIERLGVGDAVHLAGWHDHEALPAFFSAADAIALASVREQFGLILVEGMACGLPAIAVDRFGPSDIVETAGAEASGWLVEPDDLAAMAGALAAALGDPAERARRGAAAQRAVLERYAWPALAARLAGVLGEVAAGAVARGRA